MIRVAKLATELNVPGETILFFLERKGIENPTISTKLSDELENEFRNNYIEIRGQSQRPIEGLDVNKFIERKQ